MGATEPATVKERALWTLHRLAAGRGICNIGFGIRVDGPLRWWPLQEALDQLARRHPGLRTVFTGDAADLRRVVAPADDARLALESVATTEDRLAGLITATVAEPFDLETGPLVRVRLIALPTGSVVCFAAHHIVADWTTAMSVLRELGALYDAAAAGEDPPAELSGVAPAAADPEPGPEELDYWREHLAGIDASRLVLGHARPVPSPPTFAGGRVDRPLAPPAAAAVERLRVRTRSSDNIVMLAAYCVLLARHGAGPDLVVGVPVSSRRSGSTAAFGYHVSTLPIRVRVDPDGGFDELVKQVRAAFLGGLEHSAASFESVHRLAGSRSPDWRAPLFRHTFNYRPVSAADDGLTVGGRPARQIDAGHGLSRLDLDLIVFAGAGATELTAVFSTEAHDRARIEEMIERYQRLLVALDADPGAAVGSVELRCAADLRLEAEIDATERSWPAGASGGAGLSVAHRIYEQGLRTPDAVAVGDWTYGRLLAAAAGVAEALTARGIAPGDVVGLHLDRGPLLAACALGVWTVGAAYLPLDPAHPAERSAFELEDGGVRILLSDVEVPSSCAAGREVLSPVDLAAAPTAPHPGPLAYLIYTSGSTGRPKGVEVGHPALANVVHSFGDLLAATPDDRFLWLTTFSFDISGLELFLPLSVGAQVVPVADRDRLSASGVAALIDTRGITVVQATPTTWRLLEPELTPVRWPALRVLCGGEPLPAALAERILATGCRLFNVYGPTETTIWSTVAELRSPVPAQVPIGRPIANTTATVRDPAGRPVPPGVPGELCLGGAGLAAGYRGDPVRTADRFPTDEAQGRYYRTGDEVVLAGPAGFAYRGRTDRQVKIRGQRIEPGEVEAVLAGHPDVAAAAAFTGTDTDGGTALTVAVRLATAADGAEAAAIRTAEIDGTAPVTDAVPVAVSADGGGADTASDDPGSGVPRISELDGAVAARLLDHARHHLPAAAVPSRLVAVDRFPLTGNGKVDHRALAESVSAASATPADLPPDPTVRTIVEVWRAVLGAPGLGADSQFFLSGGHSLAAVRVAERLTAELGVAVGFDTVFEAPTPVLLAARVAGLRGGA